MSPLPGNPRPRRAAALAAAATLALLAAAPLALAGDRGSPGPQGPVVAPLWAPDAGMRVDGRASPGVYDGRMASPSMTDAYRAPSMRAPCATCPGTPYVTPTGYAANGPYASGGVSGTGYQSMGPVPAQGYDGPWGPPAEVPDPRDFDEYRTLDELANPHYEIREEIWSTPEEFITRDGVFNPNGIGYVPYWARNTVRWGRFSFFPFLEFYGTWSSNIRETDDPEEAFEFTASAGILAEYLFPGGKTKFKAAARADYHWYTDALSDTFTYLGGLGIEHRFTNALTVDAGVEFERERVLVSRDLDPTLGDDDDLVERETAFVNGRLDAVPSPLRLEAGATWTQNRGTGEAENRLDYDEWMGYARLGVALRRHESFLYGEYRYIQRDVVGVGTDLDQHHEVRVGLDNIMPLPDNRRWVGNVFVGYAWEEYENGVEEDLWTAGVDLIWRPDPYWSAYFSYVHQTEFSTVADFNTEDEATAAVTRNFDHRWIGRAAVAWSHIQPEGDSASDRFAVGVGVRWVATDNVDFTADYEYARRLEGAGLSEADEHRVTLGVTLHLR